MDRLRQLSAAVPRPLHIDRMEMHCRVDKNAIEFQIVVIRRLIEAATAGMLNTFEVSEIDLSEDGRSLTYYTPTGHLTWANRHLLHEVVLLVADKLDVQGTIIVEGGNSRPVEEKGIIHAYQGDGKPALPLLPLKKEDAFVTRGARITRHTFGRDGIKLDPDNNIYVAFFPVGLGLP